MSKLEKIMKINDLAKKKAEIKIDTNKKYHKVMMDTAIRWSKLSYCKRRQVGAVIAINNRIISVGYNGTISGTPNNCEKVVLTCPNCSKQIDLTTNIDKLVDKLYREGKVKLECECGTEIEFTDMNILVSSLEIITKESTLHAEENAIAFCVKNGISVKGATIYITTSPCIRCARLIAQSGISKVIYLEEYKDNSGIELLKENGVRVVKYSLEEYDGI